MNFLFKLSKPLIRSTIVLKKKEEDNEVIE